MALIKLVTVVLKLASSPRAAASSFSVLSAPGALSIVAVIAACTNAVVAICVVSVPALAVGAAGVPVNVGDAIVARSAIAVSASLSLVSTSD